MIATHFHHLADGSPVRVLQSQAILSTLGDIEGTVVLGDLNARPGDPEIELFREAGFVEALEAANISPGYTYNSVEPYEQIDYIWVSPDLTVSDVVIPNSNASDHLGIAATVAR
jgi:endonuclease/exonuclease/phosphatase family metal-dependent hydrolase